MSLISNKQAHLNYTLLDKFEAGLLLLGNEVKSLRNKHGEITGAHVVVRGGEVFIVNMEIPPYQPSNTDKNYNPVRTRKLLLNQKEIRELEQQSKEKGLTIIPVSLYNKGRVLKLEIALVKGKKQFDKRQDIKKRDTEREIGRTLKS